MATTKDHYDRHLGAIYSWMTGDLRALCRRNAEIFERLGLRGDPGGIAVDLGAGQGAQSIPLAERGFEVIALDFCPALVAELRGNTAGSNVTAIEGDLRDFRRHVPRRAEAVICMGDTLTHLESLADVEQLVRDVAAVLTKNGKLVATFRDYVSREAQGESRFIPVKADDETILTCFLDYAEDHVTIYDLVHRKADGAWKQEISSYRKLRLDPVWLEAVCSEAGLETLERSSSGGMITFVAARREGQTRSA